ncbi:MAG: hypothetical protein COB85_01535 [Bacteroidetes bacterium]|nr:MAG: hypothetical protein COB85_01535 [Bacteroidota bacterium]
MKNKLKILSLVLVGLYSLGLLHNLAPHQYLDELGDNGVLVSHTHGHEHHNHGANDNKDWVDLLLTILHDVSHQNIGEDHCEKYIAQDFAKTDSRQKILLVAYTYVLLEVVKPSIDVPTFSFDPPPLLGELAFSSSAPLRGPPTVA